MRVHTHTHTPAQLPLETQGKNKTYNSIRNFLLLIPAFHALRRTALWAASPGWGGSGPLCQHSLILARRQDRCHGVWAASQHYGNFKAPFATISTFPHSCLLPPQTGFAAGVGQGAREWEWNRRQWSETAVEKRERFLESDFEQRGKITQREQEK